MNIKSFIKKLFILLITVSLTACSNTIKEESYHEVSTIEKAVADAGFPMEIPEELASSVLKEINVYDSGMIEVIYLDLNHHETGRIRKAKGNYSDISNNFEEYARIEDNERNGIVYTMKCIKSIVYLVLWNDNGYTYSLYVTKGKYLVDMYDVLDMIK